MESCRYLRIFSANANHVKMFRLNIQEGYSQAGHRIAVSLLRFAVGTRPDLGNC